ncbi:hypothetical protein QWA68_013109 [Fusarium oxysporum]|nr:hypothetical protein QWA68_013109 [Fusarium oxysporum]
MATKAATTAVAMLHYLAVILITFPTHTITRSNATRAPAGENTFKIEIPDKPT